MRNKRESSTVINLVRYRTICNAIWQSNFNVFSNVKLYCIMYYYISIIVSIILVYLYHIRDIVSIDLSHAAMTSSLRLIHCAKRLHGC